jgi:hypothetical protein
MKKAKLVPKAVIATARTPGGGTRYTVNVHWTGAKLDRPHTFGWSTGSSSDLAARLARAVNAGAVFSNPEVVKDVNGKTYVEADQVPMIGRRLNADLTRIGF